MMGVFINTLPLRMSLGKCEVSELIAQVNTRLQGLLEYEQTPLSEAQRCSGVDTQMPLFSAVLNYRHTQVEAVETGSGPRVIDNYERTNYPFNVSVEDLGQAHCFGLDIQVDSSVGAERVAGYFLTMLSSLLAALEAGGSQAVSQLEMLTDEERNRQLSTWNDTARPYPATDSLVSLFEAQADVRGEAVAACQGEASISYAELDKRANQVARYLRSEGAAKGSLIGLCFERHIDMLVGMLGILKAGCAYVPLDPAYPQARLKFMCEDANLKFVLTERAIERRNLLPQGTLCVLDDATVIEHIARQSDSSLDVGVSFDDLAYVIYTSGSTGQPKGVMITHQNAVAMLSWAEQFYTPAQRAHVLAST
ncbi:non-ribosomal peptide synthetase, partial [Pseudoalteromonas rubra]